MLDAAYRVWIDFVFWNKLNALLISTTVIINPY
jgi:hypothetical protein